MVTAVFKLLCADRQTDKNGELLSFSKILFTYATKMGILKTVDRYIGFSLVN